VSCGAGTIALSASQQEKPERGRDGRAAAALRKARTEQAAYLDAVDEVRAAAMLRLQLLADDLAPVVDELPGPKDNIYCVVVPGEPPRFWVDLLAYVVVGDDGRTYRLLQNASGGRATLFETADRGEMAEKITDYVAHRAIEREREAAGALARVLGQPQGGYSAAALILAWTCGFAVGALTLLVAGLAVLGLPGR